MCLKKVNAIPATVLIKGKLKTYTDPCLSLDYFGFFYLFERCLMLQLSVHYLQIVLPLPFPTPGSLISLFKGGNCVDLCFKILLDPKHPELVHVVYRVYHVCISTSLQTGILHLTNVLTSWGPENCHPLNLLTSMFTSPLSPYTQKTLSCKIRGLSLDKKPDYPSNTNDYRNFNCHRWANLLATRCQPLVVTQWHALFKRQFGLSEFILILQLSYMLKEWNIFQILSSHLISICF